MIATSDMRTAIQQDATVLAGAVVMLYQLQTVGEQQAGVTAVNNSVGFNGRDAGFGTSLAEQIQTRHSLSEKQLAAARRMMAKYAGQIERLGGTLAGLRALAGDFGTYRSLTLPPKPVDDFSDLEDIE